MQQQRPQNPYRQAPSDGVARWAEVTGSFGEAPRRHDTTSGPGLLAADVDRIARDHYRDGYSAGRASREGEAVATQQALAEAFDEGATAQDGLNTALVWRAVRERLIARLHFPLMAAMQGPKSGHAAALGSLRLVVDELLDEALDAQEAAYHAVRER